MHSSEILLPRTNMRIDLESRTKIRRKQLKKVFATGKKTLILLPCAIVAHLYLYLSYYYIFNRLQYLFESAQFISILIFWQHYIDVHFCNITPTSTA